MKIHNVNRNLVNRLKVQAEEAVAQGLHKTANSLKTQINKIGVEVREDNLLYVYSSAEFNKDINSSLWELAIRAADFYNCSFDAAQVQNFIDKLSAEFKNSFIKMNNLNSPVGAFEPPVAGEAVYFYSLRSWGRLK